MRGPGPGAQRHQWVGGVGVGVGVGVGGGGGVGEVPHQQGGDAVKVRQAEAGATDEVRVGEEDGAAVVLGRAAEHKGEELNLRAQ